MWIRTFDKVKLHSSAVPPMLLYNLPKIRMVNANVFDGNEIAWLAFQSNGDTRPVGENVTKAVLSGVLGDLITVAMLSNEVGWNTLKALIWKDFAESSEIANSALSPIVAIGNRP